MILGELVNFNIAGISETHWCSGVDVAIYGEEASILRSQIYPVEVGVIRCLRVIRGSTKADRLQNIKIREDTCTPESITNVIRHRRLRWFGHVCHMQRDNIVTQASNKTAEERKTTEEVE